MTTKYEKPPDLFQTAFVLGVKVTPDSAETANTLSADAMEASHRQQH